METTMTSPIRTIVRVKADIADLIPRFLENRNKDVELMAAALARGDFHAIRVIGHNMAGTGAGYGFQKITDIGREIEAAALRQSAGEIDLAVNKLAAYLKGIEVTYA